MFIHPLLQPPIAKALVRCSVCLRLILKIYLKTTKNVDYAKDFFGKPAFLTVSGQLNAEIYACALSDVYTFGPTFRAENSNTARHLAEFWMIEPEIAFADLNDDMELAEAFLKSVISYVLDNCKEDIEFFDKRYLRGSSSGFNSSSILLLSMPHTLMPYASLKNQANLLNSSPNGGMICRQNMSGILLKSIQQAGDHYRLPKADQILRHAPK